MGNALGCYGITYRIDPGLMEEIVYNVMTEQMKTRNATYDTYPRWSKETWEEVLTEIMCVLVSRTLLE
jgi:hypothetical protein